MTFKFLQALGGYMVFGKAGDQDGEFPAGASSVLTGACESARQNNYTISPELGSLHEPSDLLTDFPLAPTNPIDAGIWRFCQSCHKCANLCPGQAISQENQPSYEIPQQTRVDGVSVQMPYHNPGPKHFWSDVPACTMYRYGAASGTSAKPPLPATHNSCYTCFTVCTFNVDHAAMIHNLVKSTISTTGVFDGFFYKMSENLGYGGFTDANDFWDLSLPSYGVDSTIGAGKGGYKK
jgi:reductive dehalogenase